MGKLFFTENAFKRNTERITFPNAGKNTGSTRIVFEKREVPDKIDVDVYGTGRSNDPWGEYGAQQRLWRANYDAHLKIGDVALTMSLQEMFNLYIIMQETLSNNETRLRHG